MIFHKKKQSDYKTIYTIYMYMYNDKLPEMKWILYGACVVKTNFIEEEYNTKKQNEKRKDKQKNRTLWLFLHVCLIVFILKKSHQLYYH